MNESHFEITVVYKGYHFFTTEYQSLNYEGPARRVYRALKNAFKKRDGFEILVSYRDTINYEIDPKCKDWTPE